MSAGRDKEPRVIFFVTAVESEKEEWVMKRFFVNLKHSCIFIPEKDYFCTHLMNDRTR
jgi:hypothetical protein